MTDLLLDVTGVSKRFPGVKALDGVELQVARGEVHALLGENGAGKSTVLKILSGAQPPDEGELRYDGTTLGYRDTPIQRQLAGIVTIYQEFNLLPHMSVAENMYLGREPLVVQELAVLALDGLDLHAAADVTAPRELRGGAVQHDVLARVSLRGHVRDVVSGGDEGGAGCREAADADGEDVAAHFPNPSDELRPGAGRT